MKFTYRTFQYKCTKCNHSVYLCNEYDMFATKLFLQFSNKSCLDLLVCTELWNRDKNDDRLLVLHVNLLTNHQATSNTLLLHVQAANTI